MTMAIDTLNDGSDAPAALDSSFDPSPQPQHQQHQLQQRSRGHVRSGLTRARAACTLCRRRRVRCDALERQPCSTCNYEGENCVMPQLQRRKKSHALPAATGQMAVSPTVIPPRNAPQQRSDCQNLHSPPHMQEQLQPTLEIGFNANETEFATTGKADEILNWDMVVEQTQQARVSLPEPYSQLSPPESVGKPPIEPAIPPYLKPIPSHLRGLDAEYLWNKGALSVPEPELRNAILRSYTEYIHPTLPILDLRALQASIKDPTSSGLISFTLFQAIMFAGVAWVDVKYLRKLGFLTRRAARKAFYLKARMLYDLDFEQDRVCLIQSLLLLTLWWQGPTEQKDGWYWSCLSLSISRTIGLNREPGPNIELPSKRLRRKIWWSCRMRDTICALGLNRAPRQREGFSDVSMLTMDDFEIEECQTGDSIFGVPVDQNRSRQLAVLCIEMAKLCHVGCHILEVAWIENPVGRIGTLSNQENGHASMASPQKKRIDSRQLKLCEDELRVWRNAVPAEALHQHPMPSFPEASEQPLLIHRALLSMLYLTGLISVYRPRASAASNSSDSDSTLPPRSSDSPREMVRDAAAQITEIMMDLYRTDIVKLLPASGISCVIPVIISHVHDMQCSDDVIRRAGQTRLEQCKQILIELSDAHIAAEWVLNFLRFSASQVRRKGTVHRRPTGMMHGEIEWDINPQAQQLVTSSVVLMTPENQHDEIHSTVNQSALSAQGQGKTQPKQSTQSYGTGPQNEPNFTLEASYSPDLFSDILNFPQTWLGIASEPFTDMDWFGEIQITPDATS